MKILERENQKKGKRYINVSIFQKEKLMGEFLGLVFCGASLFELLLEPVLFPLRFAPSSRRQV